MMVKGLRKDENMIVSYIRATGFEWDGTARDKEPREPYGCVVALLRRGQRELWLGWSICSRKDVFSKQRAIEIAINRARFFRHSGWGLGVNTPLMQAVPIDDWVAVKTALVKIWDRASRYFKQLDDLSHEEVTA